MMIITTLILLHFVIFSLNTNMLDAITTRIAPTLYVGYAIYALTLDKALRSNSVEI